MITTRAHRERIERLAAALDGDTAPEDAPAEVRHLVAAASRIRAEVEAPRMDAAAHDRVRDRLLAEIHLSAAEAEAEAPARVARSPRAVLATGLASALVAAGGVTVAAQESLPGDALYGLKKATESVRTAVASDPVEMSRLELQLATERLGEIVAATERGDARPSLLIDALREMDARSIAGVEGLVRVAEIHDEATLLDEAATFTSVQFTALATVFRDLPVTVRPHAEDSLAVLRALRLERVDPALEACADCQTALPTAAATGEATAPLIAPLPGDATIATSPEREDPPAEPSDGPTSTPPPARSPGTDLADAEDDAEQLLDGVRTRRSTDGTGLVPPLPGPLEDVGTALDDTVSSVLDGAGSLLDGTTDVVDETVNGLGGVLEDTADGLGGLLGR